MRPNCRQLRWSGWRAEYFYFMAHARYCETAYPFLLPWSGMGFPWEWSGLPLATNMHHTKRMRWTHPSSGIAVTFLTQRLQTTAPIWLCGETTTMPKRISVQLLNHSSINVASCKACFYSTEIQQHHSTRHRRNMRPRTRFFFLAVLFASWFVTWVVARYLILNGSWDKDSVPGTVFKKNPNYHKIFLWASNTGNEIIFLIGYNMDVKHRNAGMLQCIISDLFYKIQYFN